MGPGGQRRIHQTTGGVGDGEVHRGAGAVHGGDELLHPERLRQVARRQRGDGHVEGGGILLDGAGEQRMRRQFTENPEAVFEGRLHGRGESHGVTQVFGPVVGVERRSLSRVPQRRGVVGHVGRPGLQPGESLNELIEDRIHLRRVGGHVHIHLRGHLERRHTLLLPGRDQVADGPGVASDERRRRRGHHRKLHV